MDLLGSDALFVDHPSCLSHELFAHFSVLLDLLIEILLKKPYLLLEGCFDNIDLFLVISDQGFVALGNPFINLSLV